MSVPFELSVLVLAALLAVFQLFLFAVPANREVGSDYLAGPRDEGVTIRGRVTGRLQRAFNNHMEGLVLFAIGVIAVVLADKTSGLTAGAAVLYLLARIAYVPAYAYGWTPWRSVIWGVGFLATLVLLIAAIV